MQAVLMIYADNAATTPLDTEALSAMREFLAEYYANPSQPYSYSRKAKHALNESRARIAQCINARPDEIFFTSGGSESDNQAVKCSGRRAIITSAIEHKAVLESCYAMRNYYGHEIHELPVDEACRVIIPALAEALTHCHSPALVSVMLANNETGVIQPIHELAQIAHSHGALFHTDAVQALGHVPVDVQALGVDMLSGSAHKFNGPRGVGFLYVRRGVEIRPLIHGGSQECGLRAGTENTAGVVGMSIALTNNCREISRHEERLLILERILIDGLKGCGIDFRLNGDAAERLPGLLSLSFRGANGERILHRLDLKDICISTGSACDGMKNQISRVITRMNVPHEYAGGTIRISFGKCNTPDDAAKIAREIANVIPTQ